jgi:hypothetical protein
MGYFFFVVAFFLVAFFAVAIVCITSSLAVRGGMGRPIYASSTASTRAA